MECAAESSIGRHFAGLTDPRIERTREHRLVDIVTIALCAVLCGAGDWVAIETFGRVFDRLDPAEFRACFLAWVRGVSGQEVTAGIVAIDGKTVRRSHDRERGKAALHLVSAWASANGLVLGQVATDEKSNEIT